MSKAIKYSESVERVCIELINHQIHIVFNVDDSDPRISKLSKNDFSFTLVKDYPLSIYLWPSAKWFPIRFHSLLDDSKSRFFHLVIYKRNHHHTHTQV